MVIEAFDVSNAGMTLDSDIVRKVLSRMKVGINGAFNTTDCTASNLHTHHILIWFQQRLDDRGLGWIHFV